jgi:hypothetical protein
MNEVSKGGRTILFVSHNMDAVLAALHAHRAREERRRQRAAEPRGRRQAVPRAVQRRRRPAAAEEAPLPAQAARADLHRPEDHRLRRARNVTDAGGSLTFEIDVENFDDLKNLTCGVALQNARSQRVAFFHTLYHSDLMIDGSRKAKLVCHVPSLPLVPNTYFVELVMADGYGFIERVERADRLEVVFADVLGTGRCRTTTRATSSCRRSGSTRTPPEAALSPLPRTRGRGLG